MGVGRGKTRQWVLPRQPLLGTVFHFLSLLVKPPSVLFFPFESPYLSPFLFQTGCLSFFWSIIESCDFLCSPSRHGASWLAAASPDPLYIYVGNTNRCTDEQMEIEREGETDAERFVTLLRLHTVHRTHLFPLNCCTFLKKLNCYLWQKCHSVLGLHISRSSGSAGGFPFRAFHILD